MKFAILPKCKRVQHNSHLSLQDTHTHTPDLVPTVPGRLVLVGSVVNSTVASTAANPIACRPLIVISSCGAFRCHCQCRLAEIMKNSSRYTGEIKFCSVE
jgi:hypothetical protein